MRARLNSKSELTRVVERHSVEILPPVHQLLQSPFHCLNMYENFFGLSESPFNVTPDPRCLYLTRQSRETLERLTHGVLARKALILLSGKVGTGKTTLLYAALRQLEENPALKNKMATAFIVHPTLTCDEFLEAILDDLEVPVTSTSKPVRLAALLQKLLEVRGEGGTAVLVVDEAQLLSVELLEEIGWLLDQTVNEKLLQIVLSGQPEIEEKLNQIEWYHLRQQVAVHCKMPALSFQETHGYIQHRLSVVGAKCPLVFARQAVDAVYEYSHGIPRVINLLCDHALASAYLNRVWQVSPHFIEEAALKIRFDDYKLPAAHSHGLHSSDAVVAKLTALTSSLNREKVRIDEVIAETRVVAALDAFSSALARRLPVSAIGSPNRTSRKPGRISILTSRRSLDRWCSFAQKRCWILFSEAGLAGGALFTLAQRLNPLAPWQHLERMTFGYAGLLLMGASLGLGGYLLAHECRSRHRTPFSIIKCLLKAQIDGKLAPRIGHIREWLQAPL
jgi:general secretion pathway protein A